MRDDIQNYISRPKRYANIDGTGEMLVGLTLVGYFLAGWLEAQLPENSATWARLAVIYASLAVAVVFALWVRRTIKRRITWPRTGYAAYPRGGRMWWITIVAACVNVLAFVLVLALLIRRGHIISAWNLSPKVWNVRVVLLIMISILAYAVWIFHMGGSHWWKWLVLLLMISGTAAFALAAPGDFGQWARPPVLCIALLWLVSGAGTLYSYIHHTKSVPRGRDE